ncbi:uncharacterized protein LOC144435234 [Glandiceps talaboti]
MAETDLNKTSDPLTTVNGNGNGQAKKKPTQVKKSSRSSRGRAANQLKNLVLGMETTIPDMDEDDEDLSIWQAAMLGRDDICRIWLERDRQLVNKYDAIGAVPIHYAVRFNHKAVVKELLSYGADPNVRVAEYKLSSLHMAARRNFSNILRRLLSNGADVNLKDYNGAVPLHYSARYGHHEITEILLRHDRSDVNVQDGDKMSPLHHAATYGNVPMCELLLKYGADLRAKEINDITPLMFASIRGNMETMKFIIEAGKTMHIASDIFMEDVDDEGSNALHLAIVRSHTETAIFCLDEGADVNSKKFNGHTPLHIAAITGNADLAKLLIERGAKVNAKDDEQMTPLHRASLYSRMDVMKLLVGRDAFLETKDLEMFTPLLAASWKGQTVAAKFLIDAGASITVTDRESKSCLHWAVEGDYFNFAVMLLENGCNALLDEKDKKDQTPMHYAAESGNAKILNFLIEKGAKVDEKDIEEQLPLHVASENGRLECLLALAKACPTRINDDDADGCTPLLLASAAGHEKVVLHLLKVGADIASRDENRRTGLAIAAKEGNLDAVKILVKNHADIDAVDKNRNTPLHLSAAAGHYSITKYLLDKGANPTLINDKNQNCLDIASANLQEDTATAVVQNKRWQDVVSQPGPDGFTSFYTLIQRLPDVALVVLDRCVKYSHSDRTNPALRITYNYQHIDPGPDSDVTLRLKKRWSAVKTMVRQGREDLLKHDVCKTLLEIKWRRFACPLFVLDFFCYIMYLTCLTTYAMTGPHMLRIKLDEHGCAMKLDAPPKNASEYYDEGHYIGNRETGWHLTLEIYILIFIVANILREMVEMYKLKLHYILEISNYVDWGMYISTFIFILPFSEKPCAAQWKAGAIAVFLSWINLILYFRRIDMFGIYIVMFFQVVKSFMKALVVILLFIAAFTSAFYMLLQKLEVFSTPWDAAMKVLVMTVGELDYTDMFHSDDADIQHFYTVGRVMFVIFIFLMPIVLMNLMVGIAVGDINRVEEGAYIEKVEMQVELIEGIERTMPRWLQRKFYAAKLVVEPYKQTGLQKLKNRFSRRKDQAKAMGKATVSDDVTMDSLKEYIEDFQTDIESRLRLMGQMMELQGGLLQKMGEKMEIPFDDADFRAMEDAMD